jgi:PAS domain S-box-containing protein
MKRKHAEPDLLYRTTIDAVPDKIHVIDSEMRVLLFNDAFRHWQAHLGMDGDPVGKPLLESFPFLGDRVLNEYRRVLQTGKPLFTEESRVIKGHRLFVEVAKIPLVEDGHTTRVVTVVRDVTAQKLAAEQQRDSERRLSELEAIINRSPAMVFLWRIAPGFPVDFASDNVSQLGYRPGDFTSGRVEWTAITHPDDLPRLVSEVGNYLDTRTDEWSQVYRLAAASGEYRWFEDRNLVIRDASGAPTHIQGIVLDVTSRRRLEEEILAISAREKERIGRDLHDSLGQDLTGLSLLASALATRLGNEASPHAEAAAHIAELAKGASAHSRRIARGLVPVAIADGGLAVALEQLAAEAERSAGVPCRCAIRGSGLVYDNRIATHLYYIASEAVHNAVRHAGATIIKVRLSVRDGEGELCVEDDGRGLGGQEPGTGMGMRIMRYRAGSVGGSLTVSSDDGNGVIVRCRFPNRSKTETSA